MEALGGRLEHLFGRGQALAAFAGPAVGSRQALGRGVVQPCVEDQAAGQVAVLGQVQQHTLAAVGRVGDRVETPGFIGFAQHGEHVDGQFGAGCGRGVDVGGRRFSC